MDFVDAGGHQLVVADNAGAYFFGNFPNGDGLLEFHGEKVEGCSYCVWRNFQ